MQELKRRKKKTNNWRKSWLVIRSTVGSKWSKLKCQFSSPLLSFFFFFSYFNVLNSIFYDHLIQEQLARMYMQKGSVDVYRNVRFIKGEGEKKKFINDLNQIQETKNSRPANPIGRFLFIPYFFFFFFFFFFQVRNFHVLAFALLWISIPLMSWLLLSPL